MLTFVTAFPASAQDTKKIVISCTFAATLSEDDEVFEAYVSSMAIKVEAGRYYVLDADGSSRKWAPRGTATVTENTIRTIYREEDSGELSGIKQEMEIDRKTGKLRFETEITADNSKFQEEGEGECESMKDEYQNKPAPKNKF
jgi:hypothetical protein